MPIPSLVLGGVAFDPAATPPKRCPPEGFSLSVPRSIESDPVTAVSNLVIALVRLHF